MCTVEKLLEKSFSIVSPSIIAIYTCVYNDKKKRCYKNTLLIYTNYLEYKAKYEISVWDYRKRQRSNLKNYLKKRKLITTDICDK